MLFVALSSLQGRPMARAFDELAALEVGVQLTPGNLPTPDFRAHVARSGVATRTHHGFAFAARKQPVWIDGRCVVDSDSVHPPEAGPYEVPSAILEVMYPGHALGTGDEVERAIADRVRLAVDVSHVFIQRTLGVMTDRVWRLLGDYDRICELHVSANQGRLDTHQPLAADSFGLGWARERCGELPLVLECYMHRLSADERRRQIDLAKELAP